MKQKLFVLCLSFSLLSISMMAQDEQEHRRVYDIGLRFSSLNSFGISYKMGNLKNHFRVTALMLNFSDRKDDLVLVDTTISNTLKRTSIGFGLRTGYERMIPLAKHFDLRVGADAGISYFSNKAEAPQVEDYYLEYTLGIYPVIGVSYYAGEHFAISAELSPGFYYSYGKTKEGITYPREQVTKEWGVDLSTGSASITVAYRISKIVPIKQ